ncbi:MAG: metallophosphoesterase [Candidatus Marinimicrobia bacterium]|nr:metallophosphoesterase [Candidatus Neomarinimicrobiota bacterium]MCF7901829.1 metallophosphoesterase [Candidatus Neomarinimicrobiota bacterium]
MPIFIFTVLLIYAAVNGYILMHVRSELLRFGWPAQAIAWGIVFLMLAYPFGRILEAWVKCQPSSILIYLGAYYLGLMVFLLVGFLAGDLVRLISLLAPKTLMSHDWLGFISQYWRTGILIIAVIGVIFGHVNARKIRIRTVDIPIQKTVPEMKSLNVVMVSDIHMGTIIDTARLSSIVETVNILNPDMILLVGDIVDEDVDKLVEQDMTPVLQRLKTRFGSFAVTGNHEFISGNPQMAVRYLEEADIKVLEDDVVLVDQKIYIVGRTDRSGERFTGVARHPLAKLIQPLDKARPIILMDHQPFGLEEAEMQGVDLQVSGHTHHGQIWPFNYITNRVYEKSWGYLKKGATHYYVSSGVGTWGPPIRTGSVPEVVQLKLHFN